ncbi:LLM class flavin-dependent oxidoreductase [Metasolibacillus meyeri]|uniref:LLM class flavin-dependent oxidoreductase n=2 Tax=Metasolibacillus meyeri TaxID=1071052 RepID=A0AAW9NTT8_9BACL|nr:LLM class flavin-dependent oxidoreductase [Metasolibacillus meyeri]
MTMYQLSILDQSPVLEGDTPRDALLRTVELAQFAEQQGYKRFWVSEHHQATEVAGSSPEVLVSYILAKTNHIRVGSGGVMLSHYSPYKVAENFNVLANLAPGRVDLGIGKAPGGLPQATKALQYNALSDTKDFPQRVEALQRYVQGNGEILAQPIPSIQPELILLGGSVDSAKHAATLGITYVFAQFINSDEAVLLEALQSYKEISPKGNFAIGVAVIAADTEEEAQRLATDTDIYKVHVENDRTYTLTSEETAERFGKESGKKYTVERTKSPVIFGTVDKIREKFEQLHAAGVEEFILHNPIREHASRFRSIELLSPLQLAVH